MSSLPPTLVKQGFWVDHSFGTVLGSTITLRSFKANILIVLLSFLITLAGAHLWDLIAFLSFLRNATDDERDAAHHQHQLLLRNTPSPSSHALTCIKMAFAWRRHPQTRKREFITAGTLASLCSIGFLVAGFFSAFIVRTNGLNVLVAPPVCGHWGYDTIADTTGVNGPNELPNEQAHFKKADTETDRLAYRYSQTCYDRKNTGNPACAIYVRHEIPFKTDYDDCPFPGTCKTKAPAAALAMDTGLLDSNDAFGINAESQNRIYVRIKNTCGVIDADMFKIKLPSSFVPELVKLNIAVPGEQAAVGYDCGITAAYEPLIESPLTTVAGVLESHASRQYILSVFQNWAENPHNYWGALQSLFTPNSDTTLMFIGANAVVYSRPVDDPLFSAHRKTGQVYASGSNRTYWGADDLRSILGCKSQFCTSPETCTKLGGFLQALQETDSLEPNAQQAATIRLFMYQMSSLWLGNDLGVAGAIDPPPLKALDELVSGGISNFLPDNQWEIESKHLFSFSLATLQQGIANFATGPLGIGNDSEYYEYLAPAASGEELKLCHSQKMKAPAGFSNISVFGLSFTIGVCALIVLLNVAAPSVARWYSRRNNHARLSLRHWIRDGMFQVQRTLFESKGKGGIWQRFDHEVPTTQEYAMFHAVAAKESTIFTSSSINGGSAKHFQG